MLDLQIRKMRAELNKSLQSRRTVEDIQAAGAAFEALYGSSVWGCYSQAGETFGDLYNAHMAREREAKEWREEVKYRCDNILSEIEGCGQPGWYNLRDFISKRPELLDRQEILDAMEERREYLEIPQEEE